MKLSRVIAGCIALLTALFVVAAPAALVNAAGSNAGAGGGVSVQGYASATALQTGTIVQLASGNQVAPATQSKLQNMFGVVVDPSQLLVSNTNTSLANEAYVAVSGTYNVLVSTQGGSISSGDYITMSSLDGVGMKASTAQSTVLGRAEASFNSSSVSLGTETLKDTAGNPTQTVTLGLVPVSINIEHNPNVKSTKVDVPQWLQRLGLQVAEKQISPVRIYLSMAITGISLITAIVMLYAGIRNAVISIGRNPMSKKSIFRALLEVILTSILILIIGLFAVYLLLKL